MSQTAVTTADQMVAKGEWTYNHTIQESHEGTKMASKTTFERCIHKAYHITDTVE